jgi:hypothetical protein
MVDAVVSSGRALRHRDVGCLQRGDGAAAARGRAVRQRLLPHVSGYQLRQIFPPVRLVVHCKIMIS